MDSQRSQSPQTDRRLRRSRDERVLFGVCGGIAAYFGIDPTIVRVAFVLGALIPPLSVLSILGYPILAIILPSEDTERLRGRNQVRGNIDELRSAASDLAGEVRGAVTNVTRRRRLDAGTSTAPAAGKAAPSMDGVAPEAPAEIPVAPAATPAESARS
jgi:phage shock protein PspC (stress-responsive transcriptional regulator)